MGSEWGGGLVNVICMYVYGALLRYFKLYIPLFTLIPIQTLPSSIFIWLFFFIFLFLGCYILAIPLSMNPQCFVFISPAFSLHFFFCFFLHTFWRSEIRHNIFSRRALFFLSALLYIISLCSRIYGRHNLRILNSIALTIYKKKREREKESATAKNRNCIKEMERKT